MRRNSRSAGDSPPDLDLPFSSSSISTPPWAVGLSSDQNSDPNLDWYPYSVQLIDRSISLRTPRVESSNISDPPVVLTYDRDNQRDPRPEEVLYQPRECEDSSGQVWSDPDGGASRDHTEPSSPFHPGALHPIFLREFYPVDVSRRAKSLQEFGGIRTNINTSARRIDRTATYSRRNSKAIIKVSPIPLESWPGATLSSHQPIPAPSLPAEAPGAESSIVVPTHDGRAYSPIQAFPTGTNFALTPAEGASLDYQVVRNFAASRHECTNAEFDADRSCHPCYEMRPVVNTLDTAPNEDGHLVEPGPSHATGSPSDGRGSRGGERVFRSPEGDSDSGTNPLPFQTQSRMATIVPLPSTFADGLPPPESIPSRDTRSSIRHGDAADAFLGITHRTTRQLDDALERGIIGSQLEAVTGLTPWLDFNALNPRTKVVIAVVILVIVLLGAVVKLVQAIQPPTRTN